MEAIILAAGRGRRLSPLTDATPKALLTVGGETLIERHLRRLAAQGFGEVVINLAWLGEQIRARLGDGAGHGMRIRYSQEPAGALETGGGIAQALALLRGDPFLVINADIWCDCDYADLRAAAGDDIHLALVENPPHHRRGDFALAGDRLALPGDGKKTDTQTYTYAGLGCFRRRAFDSFAPGRFPLLPVIERAIAAGRAGGRIHRGRWFDVGAPERLDAARAAAEKTGAGAGAGG